MIEEQVAVVFDVSLRIIRFFDCFESAFGDENDTEHTVRGGCLLDKGDT